MTSCREARELMVSAVGGHLSEADGLRLEAHLEDCADCQVERARWGLMEHLRDLPHQTLGRDSQSRVLRSLRAGVESTNVVALPQRRSGWRPALVMVAAAAVLTLVVFQLMRHSPSEKGSLAAIGSMPKSVNSGDRKPPSSDDDKVVQGPQDGVFALAGAELKYRGGSRLRLRPSQHEVELLDGEVEVDSAAGAPNSSDKLRVVTPRFVAEVQGSRSVVRLDGERTERGSVRIFDRKEHQLALVTDGQSWNVPAALEAAPAEIMVPNTPGVPSAMGTGALMPMPAEPGSQHAAATVESSSRGSDAAPDHAAPPAKPGHVAGPGHSRGSLSNPVSPSSRLSLPSTAPLTAAGQLLEEARADLAHDRTEAARHALQKALAAKPTIRERATAQLLQADALLVEKRTTEAVVEYRHVAARWSSLPEGEIAAFTVAQILWERGASPESEAALRAYVARYPKGRFSREVREHLDPK